MRYLGIAFVLATGLGFAPLAHAFNEDQGQTEIAMPSPMKPAGTAGATQQLDAGVVSNYVFRGVSQSNSNPAGQAEFDYALDGFYAGVFGSTVDIPHSDAAVEMNAYGGFRHRLVSGIGFDVGGIAYTYLGDGSLNFQEVYLGGSLGAYGAKVYYDPHHENTYVEGTARYHLGSGVLLTLYAGEWWRRHEKDYFNAGAGVGKRFGPVDVALGLTDSTLTPSNSRNDLNIIVSAAYHF